MTEKSEWQFLVDYVKDDTTDFYNDACQNQLVALWTSYCLHNSLDVDTAMYDAVLDVENYIDTQPEATPQEVAGQCWRNSKYDPPTEADADRLGRIIVWGAAVKHVDITYWENAIFHPVDVPFWMPLPVAPEEKADLHRANDR